MLVLSTLVYSELALEYRQKVKSKNNFAQVSNLTTKFLSVWCQRDVNVITKLDFLVSIKKTPLHNGNNPITDPITEMEVTLSSWGTKDLSHGP